MSPKIEIKETNLEDLIVLGDDKKIPISITFYNADGTTTKAKSLIKQLTLKELETVKTQNPNSSTFVLKKALFKQNGDKFSDAELEVLPLGVANQIASKILEVSGIDLEQQKELANF